MDEEDNQRLDKKIMRTQSVGLIMGVVALFGPAAFLTIGPSDFEIIAMMWVYTTFGWEVTQPYFIGPPLAILMSLPYTILRPVFVYQIIRYYEGKTTMIRTLIVGLIAELQVYFFVLLRVLYLQWLYMPPAYPIPELLLIGLLFMKFRPTERKKF
jgi:hypothetical protein